jgi:hypothetical protein
MVSIKVRSMTEKSILGRYRSHFQINCWRLDLKVASRPFDF